MAATNQKKRQRETLTVNDRTPWNIHEKWKALFRGVFLWRNVTEVDIVEGLKSIGEKRPSYFETGKPPPENIPINDPLFLDLMKCIEEYLLKKKKDEEDRRRGEINEELLKTIQALLQKDPTTNLSNDLVLYLQKYK